MPPGSPTRSIAALLARHGLPALAAAEPVGGGCINHNTRVRCVEGSTYFCKTHPAPPVGFFAAEAAGLRALAATGTLRVPRVIAQEEHGLLLEYLPSTAADARFWQRLGAGLAALHRRPQGQFGFGGDNFCGLTPQPNPAYADGVRFFAEQRLGYQTQLAGRRGLLPRAERVALEALMARLPQLLPAQPPALLHGDLWHGNLLCHGGEPVLVDPAAHCGLAEAELAMTRLFGGFAPAFYRSYLHHNPLDNGWEARCDLYNLYHLLNHLNLFGTGYLGQIRAILRHYA